MGKLLFLVILIVAAVALWLFVIQPLVTRWQKKVDDEEPWKVVEVHRNRMTYVELQKPGCEPQQIGEGVNQGLPGLEYEDKVNELWVEAEEVLAGKNYRANLTA
jgi:hypothetical protein